MRNKKKNKIKKTLEGKREGTRQPRVVVMPMRSAASNGGVGASKSSTRLLRERERENATPNSTEGGGVRDLVVAGYNHGDSATKRKGIQPQIFLVEKRDIF